MAPPTGNTTVPKSGGPTHLHARVDETLDPGEGTTLMVSPESSADTSNGTPTVHWTSALIAEASLAAGY